jgi:hypothetical protein
MKKQWDYLEAGEGGVPDLMWIVELFEIYLQLH